MARSGVKKTQTETWRKTIENRPALASPCVALSEELECSVCLDVFTDPVTVPCGHNFCQSCLKQCWDTTETCFCPFCKETFQQRPELKINTALRELAQLCKKPSGLIKPEVLCDFCDERKQEALKSCLTCQSSYCKTHLEPHLRVPRLKKHKLINAVERIEDYICQKHERALELYCRDDQMFICVFCTDGDHKSHNTVPLETESEQKKAQVMKSQADVQKMIEDRMLKIQDIKQAAEHRKKSMDEEKAESEEIFRALIHSIESCQREFLQMMELKQRAAEKQEEELFEDLEREITELRRRNSELEKLSQTEDHLQLIRISPSFSSTFSFKSFPEISSGTLLTVGALRRALNPLLESLAQKLCEKEIERMQAYSEDVTLDPETAFTTLILSDDGKQVSRGDIKRNVPDNPERYDRCVNVLGKEGFSSGRVYFEVQVKNKTEWDLGVARESVERKGKIRVGPQFGYWTIVLRNEDEYHATENPPVPLPLRVKPQRVGVFVDYEEGLVSFYDVESKSHIYSFTEQNFLEELYPYFSPGVNKDGKNSAPLIISPAYNKKWM